MSSCTCNCADGYSGSSCESELQSIELTVLIHVHLYLDMEEYVKVRICKSIYKYIIMWKSK